MDREAAEEVQRVPEHPVEPAHLAVDPPRSDRRVAGGTGRDMDDAIDASVQDLEQDLPRLVDLDPVSGDAEPRDRHVRSRKPLPERRVDAAGPRKAVDLLEGEHGLERVGRVERVGAADRVAQLGQAALERTHARSPRTQGERGHHHLRGERAPDRSEALAWTRDEVERELRGHAGRQPQRESRLPRPFATMRPSRRTTARTLPAAAGTSRADRTSREFRMAIGSRDVSRRGRMRIVRGRDRMRSTRASYRARPAQEDPRAEAAACSRLRTEVTYVVPR